MKSSRKNRTNRTYRAKRIGSMVLVVMILGIGAYNVGSVLQAQNMQREIADKIIRFHVIANSDSDADQSLKLEVRNVVGAMMQDKLQGVSDIETSRAIIEENLTAIQQTAEEEIAREGYHYTVETKLAEVEFPEKTYGIYTFAAGQYEALEITIGSGGGHNWWCVMYPNLCFANSVYEVPDEEAGTVLEKVLTEEEYASIIEKDSCKIRFKFFPKLNDWLDGE